MILHKILIANRGEIAVRIIRACRDLGLASVAVYSEWDRAARHVRMADEAVALVRVLPPTAICASTVSSTRPAPAAPTPCIRATGFLSENEDFAAACRDAGLTFIGPTPEAIALMGSKTAARRRGPRRRCAGRPGH